MKKILVDFDYCIYTICAALEPNYYYLGDRFFKTKKEGLAALREGQDPSELIKEAFRVPPTSIMPICKNILNSFQKKMRLNLKGTCWEGVKEEYFLNSYTNFRKDFCPVYKSSRTTKPFYHNRVKDWLSKELNGLTVEGFESDDTIAVFAELGRGESLLAHCDKDLDNIPCQHYNFMKEELYDVSREEALYCLLQQTLTGDKTDDIIGFPGLGPRTADKILTDVPVYSSEPLAEVWAQFLSSSVSYLEGKFSEEEALATINHTLPLVDVGGYWTRRLEALGLVQKVVDYRPIKTLYDQVAAQD